MTDEEAVRRVRAGDHDSYRVLVDRYAPLVFGVVRRYCSEPAEAEDLAQDVFMKAYDGLESFREDARFSSWLYRIAVNRCRDHVRGLKPVRSLEELEAAAEAALDSSSSQRSADDEIEWKERARRLRRALGELSPDYAVPFLLKYEEDLTYEEMARLLDVSVGALKVRVHRARAELRRLLEGEI